MLQGYMKTKLHFDYREGQRSTQKKKKKKKMKSRGRTLESMRRLIRARRRRERGEAGQREEDNQRDGRPVNFVSANGVERIEVTEDYAPTRGEQEQLAGLIMTWAGLMTVKRGETGMLIDRHGIWAHVIIEDDGREIDQEQRALRQGWVLGSRIVGTGANADLQWWHMTRAESGRRCGPVRRKAREAALGGEAALRALGDMLPYREAYGLYNTDKATRRNMARARERLQGELRTRIGIRRFLHIINCGQKYWRITQFLRANEEHALLTIDKPTARRNWKLRCLIRHEIEKGRALTKKVEEGLKTQRRQREENGGATESRQAEGKRPANIQCKAPDITGGATTDKPGSKARPTT